MWPFLNIKLPSVIRTAGDWLTNSQASALSTPLCWVLALGMLAGILVTASPIHAQFKPDVDLSVSPSTEFMYVKPGSSRTHTITLTHTGTIPLAVTPTIFEFSPNNQNGQPILVAQDTIDFITINGERELGTSFIVQPNTSEEIVFTVAPTDQTAKREYPLTILFQTKPTDALTVDGTASKARAAIGTNLIVATTNQPPDPLSIIVQEVDVARIVDSFRPLTFQVLLKNTGDTASPVSGYVTVQDWTGKEQQRYTLAPDMILGNSSRLARSQPSENEDFSTISPEFSFERSLLLGPLSISVVLTNPANQDQVVTEYSQNVLALPLAIIAAILAAVLTYIGYLIWSYRKLHLAKY